MPEPHVSHVALPPSDAAGSTGGTASRRPYVKPALAQLQYMMDQHVSLSASCKTTGAATGPTTANCKTQGNSPCAAFGS